MCGVLKIDAINLSLSLGEGRFQMNINTNYNKILFYMIYYMQPIYTSFFHYILILKKTLRLCYVKAFIFSCSIKAIFDMLNCQGYFPVDKVAPVSKKKLGK